MLSYKQSSIFFLNMLLLLVLSVSSAPGLCPASLDVLTEFLTVSDVCIVPAPERPLWWEMGTSASASDSRRRGEEGGEEETFL